MKDRSNLHYATISPKYTHPNNTSSTHYQQPRPSADPNSSTVEETASSTSRESITPQPAPRLATLPRYNMDPSTGQHSTSAHYNTSTYSMSKFDVSTGTDLSDDDIVDNIIYSDINDLYKNNQQQQQQNTHTIQTQTSNDINQFSGQDLDDDIDDDDDDIQPYVSKMTLQKLVSRPIVVNNDDLYATVNRKTKTKAMKSLLITDDETNSDSQNGGCLNGNGMNDRNSEFKLNNAKNYSSEYIDNSIRNINNVLNDIDKFDQYQASLKRYSDVGGGVTDYYTKDYQKDNHNSLCRSNMNSHSDHYLAFNNSQFDNEQTTRATNSLPRNSEMSGVESLDSYDSHYEGHNASSSNNDNNLESNHLHYAECSIMKPEDSGAYFDSPKHSKTSSDRLEYDLSNANIYSTLQYKTTYEDDSDDFDAKESWQRSASCRELYDFGYEFKKPTTGVYLGGDREFLTSDRIDSPVTKYDDDFRRSLYESTRKYSMDNYEDYQMAESKVYSSSYPGTTYNTIEQKRAQYPQYEFNGSQDLSHDSYELLEKSDDDFYYKFKQNNTDHHVRSCSLDSGNFIPTDYESDEDKNEYLKYHRSDMKSKSAADIMNDIFIMDDPRDLPREKLCVKSDGSFYKHVKESMGLRTSSQESHSEFYESKISKSSGSSKKSKDSVYHTDSKKSRETLKSKSGSDYNASSPEEMFIVGELLNRNNYEMPTTTAKKTKSLKKMFDSSSRNSSQDSKSDYYDTKADPAEQQSFEDETEEQIFTRQKVFSQDYLVIDASTVQPNFDSQVYFSTFPSNHKVTSKTCHVQSISLQNVEIERNFKTYSAFKSMSPQPVPNSKQAIDTLIPKKSTHIWPEEIEGLKTEITGIERAKNFRKKSDGDNIFSFDKDKIESLTTSQSSENINNEKSDKSPVYPLTPELLSEFDKQKIESPHVKPKMTTRKEELMAKTHFEEYNPKLLIDPKIQLPVSMPYPHATVERTKSDPNSLANRPRLTVGGRRHTLMHQKSIDLTPADSSEDEYLYKQIPSAPPLCRTHGSHFEMPKPFESSMGPSDIPIPITGFELPQSFFKDYEKRTMNQIKDDIPYVLHKRHIMNGTAPTPSSRCVKPKSPKSPKSPKNEQKDQSKQDNDDNLLGQGFLFTKNIDLSKVDPITLEEKVTKSTVHISSPKRERDITKRLDPKSLETLNSKLSQIESDSATSSKTDSAQRIIKKHDIKQAIFHNIDPATIKKEAVLSGKRCVKPRSGQAKNKNNLKTRSKAKTRITSFSSDDESIDSDDVFGSAEAMPTKMEFSPPQSRKEIEPILKHEYSKISQAAWARGQTMSSTEVEGSPPQCRKLADLENRYHTHKLDAATYMTSTELRRISERSISIPSSEDGDGGQSTLKCELATEIYRAKDQIPIEIPEDELKKMETDNEIDYKLVPKKEPTTSKSKTKIIEEMIDSSIIKRSKGHAPVLFAHARLNLSEGSAFASLQRQKSCRDTPTGRRAKSLDAPVISLQRLPPMNAFSSKDDTVEFEEEAETLEFKQEKKMNEDDGEGEGEVPITIEDDELELLDRLKYIEKITLQGVRIKEKRRTRTQLKSGDQLILDIPKYKFEPFSSGNSSLKTSPAVSRASSIESSGRIRLKDGLNLLSSPTNMAKKPPTKPDRGDSRKPGRFLDLKKSCNDKLKVPMEMGTLRRSGKERSKSLEKMDPKRSASKERKSVTEESELERAKRKERQQKLYESAMKQTINMLSPVRDQMPPFPPPENKISVKKDGDNIIIETDMKSKPEDHVLIAKSPRKLDSQLAKFSRSCEESKSMEKIDKANRSFEDRKKSLEDSERSDNPEDTPSKSQQSLLTKKEELKQKMEGSVVHKKIHAKSRSLEKNSDNPPIEIKNKTKSLDNYCDTYDDSEDEKKDKRYDFKRIEIDKKKSDDTKSKTDEKRTQVNVNVRKDKRTVPHPVVNIDEDMQAIISERRNLDLLKRSSQMSAENDEKDMSEGESLTSVSEVKQEDKNYYFFSRIPTIECEEPSIEEEDEEGSGDDHLPCLDRASNFERSRSEETASWVTLECEDFVGTDSLEIDNKQPTKQEQPEVLEQDPKVSLPKDEPKLSHISEEKNKQEQLLCQAQNRRNYLKLNIDKSRSSDTASSIERDPIPMRAERQDSSTSNYQKSSIDEESSVSCSIARPLGISQDYVDPSEQIRCKELRDAMLKLEQIEEETKIIKKSSPTLEKQFPVDLGSGSELDSTDPVEDKITKLLKRDESSGSGSEKPVVKSQPKIPKPPRDMTLHKRVTRAIPFEDLSQPPEQLQAKMTQKFLSTNSGSSLESKSSIESKGSLSVESRESFETESSSGSLGKAQRRGELPQRELQSTWKSFPIESSSSSVDDNWQPEHESYEKFEVIESPADFQQNDQRESDSDFQDELNDFPATFGYPEMTSNLGIGPNPVDILGYGTGFAIGRTLSRISERSTNSEKSSNEGEKTSIEEDIMSAHEEIEEEEDDASSEHQASLSSDIHSNSHHAYVSDTDRRTSAEMPDIPCDSAAAERLADIYRKNTIRNGRFSVSSVGKDDKKKEVLVESGGSQDSDDWPLPEIPPETPTLLYEDNDYDSDEEIDVFKFSDKPVPKMFSWRNSTVGVQSQDSEAWPSPPSSVIEVPVIENVHTFYVSEPQNPTQVMIESITETQCDDDEPDYAEVADMVPDLPKRDYDIIETPSECESKSSPTISIVLPYEDAAYLMSSESMNNQTDHDGCFDTSLASVNCLKSTLKICSSNKAIKNQSSMKIASPDKVIIMQPTRSSSSTLQSPLSEDEFVLNDDVFGPGTVKIEISPDDTKHSDHCIHKFSRGSNNSDTSMDDMLSASLSTFMDDGSGSQRKNLEPRRLSSGSCKKCSGSHSEEETSSFGTDLDGTVKMGVPARKCTHSSHSEDTSIGLSLSEWSTGTNTVRQYANLSGSDSVSNHSGGVKSEKSNNTKSSISSINKSTESLNEKSMSLSCGKNIPYSQNLSKDGISNSDTDKITSSGTNDESTLTLTEMVHSITEWSTSTSQTLMEQDFSKSQQQHNMEYKQMDKNKSNIEYTPLKPAKSVQRTNSNEGKAPLPGIHASTSKTRSEISQAIAKSTERPMKIPPKIVEVHEKPKVPPPPFEVSDNETETAIIQQPFQSSNRRKAFELMSQQYQSQDISESETYSDKLYNQNEKLSQRYQSQEFSPFSNVPSKPPRDSKTPVVPDKKTMMKHHSYDDKTLSKSQIRDYKTAKVRQSPSFHEHLVSSDLNKIEEEKLSSSTNTQNSETTTSTENSSPMFTRPEKLSKCSPYYSSSLSSDTPPVHQTIQKPPRKSSIPPRIQSKSPPSSNDTDSSVDFRQNDPANKFRNRGYRKKKQIPSTKKVRMDQKFFENQESSECSEGYFPEINSSSSDNAKMDRKYPDFEEEPEMLPDECEDYSFQQLGNSKVSSYPSTSHSTKFETLDMSENVDEMGFPKYDRLRNMTNPSPYKPPAKPIRQKKKAQTSSKEKYETEYAGVQYTPESGSGTETKAGLSDDVYYSSEDSFAASFILHNSAHQYSRNVELPYPDFLSDYENEPGQSCSYQRGSNDSEKSFDDSYSIVPPPIYGEDSEDEDLSGN